MTMEPNPRSTASIAGHPIHPMLIPFPIAFFVSTFVVDIVYWRTGDAEWAHASLFLLGAGLVMAALAALAGLTDFLGSRQIRGLGAAVQHLIGNVTAVVLEFVNLFLRVKSGPGFILHGGLILSLVVVLILLFTGWKGWEMVYKHHVGVSDR